MRTPPPRERLPFPISPLDDRPDLGPEAAAALAREGWGIEAEAGPLPGERDRNFGLLDKNGVRFVLKVSGSAETASRLDCQHRLVLHAKRRDPALGLPEFVPTPAGASRITRRFGGRVHYARLFRHLEGTPLSGFRRRPPALLTAIGRLVGRLGRALAGFHHSGLEVPDIPWAPRHAERVLRAAVEAVPEGGRRQLYRRLAEGALPDWTRLLALPSAPIHNDANDDNLLLVSGEPESAGPGDLALLDFGDALGAPPIVEAATAALYAACEALDPLPAAAAVLAGFARERPVSEEEADIFRAAFAVRGLVSSGVAALRREAISRDALSRGRLPGETGPVPDPYLLTSEAGVWRVLQALDAEAPAITGARFRRAAGHDPLPGAAARRAAIRRAAAAAVPPIPLPDRLRHLDLTPSNPAVDPEAPLASLERLLAAARAAGELAIGRTGEPRFEQPETEIETGPAPPNPTPGREPRTITLGIEVFAPAGTPVAAALDGTVEQLTTEDAARGGGVTLRLRHEVGELAFRTLYRHLGRDCLDAPGSGDPVRRGDPVGRVGEPPGNGGAPPRLEFQVLAADLGDAAPPRSAPGEFALLRALCPSPSPFFGLDERAEMAGADAAETGVLLEARRRRLSRVFSLAYDDPIPLVRGRGARLYDAAGRDYLDMVNNVCHVGHAHPRVAGAIARQAGLLNTNTRYLYRQLTDYAERLAATLPEPLAVVFLTNSGSEANDLALRIARNRLGNRETLVFEGGYHGNLTSLIEVSPYKLDGKGGGPSPPWLHRLPSPDGFRGGFRNPNPGFRDPEFGFAEALIADAGRRVRKVGPATLMVEAIPSCGGQIVPPPGYLGALYRAVRSAGGVIVADEVQTGFGRVGPDFWAFLAVQQDGPAIRHESPAIRQDREPELPDIVTLGKPAGNGHPLGAVVTTRELARSFETGMEYFNTFGGNPVSCAAGLAVLEVIREEGLAAHAAAMGERLQEGLSGLANRYPILGEVRGRGLFLGFEMVRDPETREPATAEARRLVNRLRGFRILNATDGPDANVIKIKPPLPFSSADADRYLHELEVALKEQF